jgi:hypothetical protein
MATREAERREETEETLDRIGKNKSVEAVLCGMSSSSFHQSPFAV